MQIVSVTLTDFKSYEQATVSFRQWTNAIIGANGSGKSTILEAIGLALFNHRPGGRIERLVREGEKSATIVVKLVSTFDDRVYEVERRFPGSSPAHYRVYDVERDHMTVAEGVAAVGDWVRMHLRIDIDTSLSDLFEHTIGVAQGTITAAFQLRTADRKRVFDPILHVEEYRRAADELLPAARTLSGQREAVAHELARMNGELTQLEPLQIERADLRVQVEALGVRKRDMSETAQQAQAAVAELDAQQEAIQSLQTALARLERDLALQQQKKATTEIQLARAKAAAEIIERSEQGHAAYLDAEQHLAKLDEQRTLRDKYRQRLSDLDNKWATLNAQCEAYANQLDELNACQAELKGLAADVARFEQLQRNLAQVQSQAKRHEMAVERERDTLARRAQADREVERITLELAQTLEMETRRADLVSQVQDVRRRKGEHTSQARVLRNERDRLAQQSARLRESDEARCPVCEAELTLQHKGELLLRIRQDMVAAEEQAAAQERLAQEAEASEQRITAQITALDRGLRGLANDAQLLRAQETLSALEQQLRALEPDLIPLQEAPSELAQMLAEMASLQPTADRHKALLGRLATRPRLVESLNTAEQDRTDAEQRQAKGRALLEAFGDLDQQLASGRAALENHRAEHDLFLRNQSEAAQVATTEISLASITALVGEMEKDCERATDQHASLLALYDATAHQEARSRLSSARSDLAAIETALTMHNQRINTLGSTIERLTQLADAMIVKQAEHDRVVEMYQTLEQARDLLRQAGPHITQQLVCAISLEASRLYAEIMDTHRGRIEWGVDYELNLEIGGHTRAFAQLSGGEQMTAALATRMAMLRQLSSIDIAFFDEPTANLDPERRQLLAEQITQVGEREWFQQIFVITHDDSFEAAAAHDVHVFKDDRGSHIVSDASGRDD